MIGFEKRAAPSRFHAVLSPVLAIALTLLFGSALVWAIGKSPMEALNTYFLYPIDDLRAFLAAPADERAALLYRPSEVIVKAVPLVLIGVGLAVAFRAGVFNIGAPGQYTLGAIFAGGVALHLPGFFPEDLAPQVLAWGLLPLCLIAGALGGLLWAYVPALLRARTGANEILTSLMLTYVAALLLDWLVRGPWRDPRGFGFPQSPDFPVEAMMPALVDGTRLHWGVFIALAAVLALWFMMARTVRGFRITVTGLAPKSAHFAGFSASGTLYFVFLLSGALAGLAGAIEASSTIGQLQPEMSAEYGFAAIIVAFLGRLHPFGALLAGLVLAITYIGGENAQIEMGLPKNATAAFQGMLLFFLLACDALVNYRLRWRSVRAA